MEMCSFCISITPARHPLVSGELDIFQTVSAHSLCRLNYLILMVRFPGTEKAVANEQRMSNVPPWRTDGTVIVALRMVTGVRRMLASVEQPRVPDRLGQNVTMDCLTIPSRCKDTATKPSFATRKIMLATLC